MQTALDSTPTTTKRRAFLILICTSAPSFMLQLDANIVSVSIPAIARSLGASFAGIEWVLSAYLLSFASLVLPAGALADRFGRKRLLIIGLSVFTAASLVCGLAPNLPVLVAARAVQGMGAAIQLSAALATLSHVFQGEARARAFSFWGAVIGIGIASGPVVGGIITELFGWRWAFFVNLPIGLALIALVVQVIGATQDPEATRFDWKGVATFAGALFLTTLALIEGNHRGWTDPEVLAAATGAVLLFLLFGLVERRQSRPMLDLTFFLKPTFLGANIAQFTYAVGMLSMLTFVPIFLQAGLNEPSGTAGVMMLPMVVPLFLVPRFVTSHLAYRFSGRGLLTLGLLLVATGLFWFAVVAPSLSYPALVGGMLLVGSGAAILNGETAKVGMTVIPKERAGMASGLSGTIRFTGLVVGIAGLGVVLYSRIATIIEAARPNLDAVERRGFAQAISAGHLTVTSADTQGSAIDLALARASFASGYHYLFLTAALFTLAAAALTWRLVRPDETPALIRRDQISRGT